MGTWFGAQQQGAQVVRDQTTRRRTMAEEDRTIAKDIVDRQRTQAGEDRDTAYNEEIRRQKLAELQRLNDIRNARASRNPAPAGGFQFGGQGQVGQVPVAGQVPVGGQGQVPVAGQGQIPIFDTSGQNDLATARDASILQGNKDYNTAVVAATQRQRGVAAARDKLLELQNAQKNMGSSQYLPKYAVPTDAGHSGLQKLFGADADPQAIAQDFVASSEAIVQMGSTGGGWGPQASGWLGINNTDMTDAEFQAALAKSNEVEQFFNTDLFGDSDAEKYFTLYPDEITKANPFYGMSKAELGTVDYSGDKRRAALAEYYFTHIKPQLTGASVDGLKPVATANGGDAVVHTKEQIAKAEAQHKDYMSKIATGINTLDDDIANAPVFMEKLNKDKKANETAIQDLYKSQLSKSNAAQLAKVVGMQVDPSLLDPTKLGGLVRQGYEQRQLLVYKAQNARKVAKISGVSSDWAEYDALRAQLSEKDVSIYAAIGEQGITELVNDNDPRRISAVLSSFTSSKIIVQPRSDGMYNLISNGKMSGTPQTADAIQKLVRMQSSPTFRAQSAANAQKQVEQQIEGASTQQSTAKNESETIRALLTEQLKGINAKDKLAFEQQFKDREWKFNSLGSDGGGFLTSTDGRTVLFNPRPGKSPSGKALSKFTDVTNQLGKDTVFRIRGGTMDFSKSDFWKSIGLPNPLNN